MRCNAHSRSKPSYTWITCIVITAILTLVYITYLLAFVFNNSFGGRHTSTNSIDAAFSALVLFPAATWIYAMTVVSYWKTALTDPGRVPREWSLTDAQIKRIQEDGNYEQRLAKNRPITAHTHDNNNDDDDSGGGGNGVIAVIGDGGGASAANVVTADSMLRHLSLSLYPSLLHPRDMSPERTD